MCVLAASLGYLTAAYYTPESRPDGYQELDLGFLAFNGKNTKGLQVG